jgi:deazaflavin-dependent oxidoreductase (nitroreductase family)
MTDTTDMGDFNKNIIEEFRANHGKVGGNFEGAPMVLLTTTGAKSGNKRTTPLVSRPEGDVIYVFASKAGAPTNPDWYYNLLAHPEIEVEFGDDKFNAVATEVKGAERDRIYAAQAEVFPGFADYQKGTDRVIPVMELRRSA